MSTPEPLRDAIVSAMADEVEGRAERDLAPELWRVSLRDGQPVLRQVGVPVDLWTMAHPQDVLAEISRIVADAGYYPGQPQDDAEDGPAYGFGFLYEGWAIQSDRTWTCASQERDAADAEAHRIHTRPDRVEVRMFTVVDREQTVYAVLRQRGGGEFDQVMVSSPGDPTIEVGGEVVGALARLVKGAAGGSRGGTT